VWLVDREIDEAAVVLIVLGLMVSSKDIGFYSEV
jgi:hypothetical protein